jgi:Type I restriction enzyme R protein N terminus (HSDR_N)
MLLINYPEPEFRIRKTEEKEQLFDPLRKKWLNLTPEEWVRQNFIQYLVRVKKFPTALIALEKELRLGELKKRFDILVYDKDHRPWMMIECKGMDIALSEDTLQQVLRYNITIPVPYLVITNGKDCFGWKKKDNSLVLLKEIPEHGILSE